MVNNVGVKQGPNDNPNQLMIPAGASYSTGVRTGLSCRSGAAYRGHFEYSRAVNSKFQRLGVGRHPAHTARTDAKTFCALNVERLAS